MPKARRVRRVVRKVEPWTVLKFSILFFLSIYLVVLVAGAVLWGLGNVTGVLPKVERFVGDLLASNNFHFVGLEVLRASVVGGLVLVVVGTGFNLLLAVLYNLISDVVGGIEVTVLEEEPPPRGVL